MNTRRYPIIVTMCAFLGATAMAQDAGQAVPEMSDAQKTTAIREFSRSARVDGILYTFVLLNNKTVEALFSGDSRYAMRARANASTAFYVQGTAGTDVRLNPKFVVEQNGKTFEGEAVNIRNFETGTVVRGAKIVGLIQLGEKIDVAQPFKIKGAREGSADFRLSKAAIKLLEN